jgi:hypothetical protein
LGGGVLEFGLEGFESGLAVAFLVFKEAETFADDFACGLVATGGDVLLDEATEFGSEGDIEDCTVCHDFSIIIWGGNVKLCHKSGKLVEGGHLAIVIFP